MTLRHTVRSLSCQQDFSTKRCYGHDLWPWKAIGFLLSWWWSSVPSYMTLKHTVPSLSCLQRFSTQRYYGHDLWPCKKNRVPPLMMVDWLIIYCFMSRLRIFHLYGYVTITDRDCVQSLTVIRVWLCTDSDCVQRVIVYKEWLCI